MKIKYYTVGGAIRDELLGVKSKDIDFAVEASSYEAMREDLISKGIEIFQERPDFFAIRGKHPKLGAVDYTLCRKEGFYSDGRRPDSVTICSIEEELSRRDFSINSMAKNEEGILIDPFDGARDLENNLLRCVGSSYERFSEDSLRLIRAIRFFITRGFRLHEDICYCLRDEFLLEKIKNISIERIYEELTKCFAYDSFATLQFFREYRKLEKVVFEDIGLKLTPKIIK